MKQEQMINKYINELKDKIIREYFYGRWFYVKITRIIIEDIHEQFNNKKYFDEYGEFKCVNRYVVYGKLINKNDILIIKKLQKKIKKNIVTWTNNVSGEIVLRRIIFEDV